MAYIKKTATGYQAQVELQGIRKSKTFPTKREASTWAYDIEQSIILEKKLSPGEKHTLRDALEKYRDEITDRNTGARWEKFRINAILAHPDWLPLDKKIGQVSTDDFGLFRDERLKIVKPRTVLREFGILSAMMEVVRKEWKWIKENPVKDVKKPAEPPARDRLITRSEIKKMLRGLDYDPVSSHITSITQSIAVCFLLAMRTGMRAGDMTGLTWENVYPRYVVIELDKVGRRKGIGRDVPLSRKAVRILEKMRGFDKKSVFGLKPQTLDARFRDIREEAGLTIRLDDGTIDKKKTFTFHDSKHTAATWIAKTFKSNKDISAQQAVFDMCKIFGWTDMNRALDYYNPSPEDVASRLD